IRSALTVNGGSGVNTLTMEDSSDNTGDTIGMAAGKVGLPGDTFFGGGSLNYAAIDALTLNASTSVDSIDILGTSQGTTTIVHGDGGGDSFLVDSNGTAPGGTVNTITSRLILFGDGGADQLLINDVSDLTGRLVTITPNLIGAGPTDNFFGGGSLQYDN